MIRSSPVVQKTQGPGPRINKTSRLSARFGAIRSRVLFAYVVLFFLALSIRSWFAFGVDNQALFYACDASEYVRSANSLAVLLERPIEFFVESGKGLLDLLSPERYAELTGIYSPLKEAVGQSGIVYPLYLVISQLAFGQAATTFDFSASVLSQCLLSAFTCVLIGLIAARCWNHKVGILAALLAALYPGFVVNAARLLSETLACFWVCVVVLLTIETIVRSRWQLAGALGIALSILQMTKSAMIATTGAVFACTLLLSRQYLHRRSLILLSVGMMVVILPIMALQQLTLGKSSFVQDRKSNYNLIVGLNTASYGWLTFPYPSFAGLDSKSLPVIVADKIVSEPVALSLTLLDKPVRLFKFPWNDFKTPIGNIDFKQQVLAHQACLLLAVIGLCLGLSATGPNKAIGAEQIRARLVLLGLIFLHGIYFLFSTLGRYGITAMPAVLVFAGAGLFFVIRALSQSDRRPGYMLVGSALALFLVLRFDAIANLMAIPYLEQYYVALATSLVLKIACLVVFIVALFRLIDRSGSFSSGAKPITILTALAIVLLAIVPVRANGRGHEWSAKLDKGYQAITQTIDLPVSKLADLSGRDCYVIVDCQNWRTLGQSADLVVDEKALEEVAVPLMPFVQRLDDSKMRGEKERYLEFENVFSQALIPTGGGNLDLRQWFAVRLPSDTIEKLRKASESKLNVRVVQRGVEPVTMFGSYVLRRNQAIVPGLALYSWDKCLYGVENEDGLSDSRFDEKYNVSGLKASHLDLSDAPGLQTGAYNVRLLVAPQGKKPVSVVASPH